MWITFSIVVLVIIYNLTTFKSIYGYSIKESLNSVIRPSDPRHLVDTIGFKCEIIDMDSKAKEYFWESKDDLLNDNIQWLRQCYSWQKWHEIY